jgi:hypothetical protein
MWLLTRVVGGRFSVIAVVAGAFAAGAGCGLKANNCPEDGAMKCENGKLSTCVQGDFGPRTWIDSGTCADNPLCASMSTLAHCEGDDIISCAGGWRTGSSHCGVDTPEGPADTHCVQEGAVAACVPPEAMPDPACGDAEVCSGGAALIYCIGGLAVSRTACLNCANHNPCHGFMGDACSGEGDCVSGLTCRPDSKAVARCTAACDPAGASPPGGPATASQSCLDLFSDGAPPATGYYLRVLPPGTVLGCVAGYCEWSS